MTKEVSEEAEVHHHGKDYVDPLPVPLLDLGELKLWSFYRALIAEFIATLLFLYVTIATVIGHKKLNVSAREERRAGERKGGTSPSSSPDPSPYPLHNGDRPTLGDRPGDLRRSPYPSPSL